MKRLVGVVVVSSMIGCGGGASQEEAFQAFAAASAAMSSAQLRAVQDAQSGAAFTDLVLSFEGTCTAGGSVIVTGTYGGGSGGQAAVFDITTAFHDCADSLGTIDGDMRWTSVIDGSKYSGTMKGSLDWTGRNASASCDYDIRITVEGSAVTYAGSVCGYDLAKLTSSSR